ncbi:MAG: GTP-binding protein [Planctomycetota bacterium]
MKIPVTLIAGFLGSGKTTLVQRILSERHGQRCAVIVNEFGALGIDGDLVVRRQAQDAAVVELSNGCICCEIQDDLRSTLADLVSRGAGRGVGRWLRRSNAGFDRILVEASGAASPGPAVQTFLVDDELSESVRLDGVVTLVHAAHVLDLLGSTVEAAQQIAYADRIVVNHADRVDAPTLEHVEGHLQSLNPLARVRSAERAQVPLDWVLDSAAETDLDERRASIVAAAGDEHIGHTPGLGSISLETEQSVDRDATLMWLEFLAKRRSHELMRAKGILRPSSGGGALVVQGVYQWIEATLDDVEPPEISRLVIIGRDLDRDEILRGWRAIGGELASVG